MEGPGQGADAQTEALSLAGFYRKNPDHAENVRETAVKILNIFGIQAHFVPVQNLAIQLLQGRVLSRDPSKWGDVQAMGLQDLGVREPCYDTSQGLDTLKQISIQQQELLQLECGMCRATLGDWMWNGNMGENLYKCVFQAEKVFAEVHRYER